MTTTQLEKRHVKKNPNPTLVDAENPEPTKEMLARATPAFAVFPKRVEHSKKAKTVPEKIRI